MVRGRFAALAWTTVLAVLPLAALRAADTELDYSVGLATGVDTNPLKMHAGGSDGLYTELRLSGAYRYGLSRGFRLFASGFGVERRHEASVANADETRASLELGADIAPWALRRNALALSVGAVYTIGRSTFTDRESGAPYLYDSVVGTTPIPDRFDYDTQGAFLRARWTANRRLQVFLDSRVERTDFVEDYGYVVDLEPIDYRSVSIEPGVIVRVAGGLAMRASIEWVDLSYAERLALDERGEEVPGTHRDYRYLDFRVAFLAEPSEHWRLRFGLSGGVRDDLYVGYNDYAASTIYAQGTRDLGPSQRLRLYVSRREIDFRHATASDIEGILRGSQATRFVGVFDKTLRESLGWYVETGLQRSDNEDPLFAYDRDWVELGIQFGR